MSETLADALPLVVVDALTSAAIMTLQELTQVEAFPQSGVSQDEATLTGRVLSAEITLLREPVGTMSLVLPIESATQLAARYLPPGALLSDDLINDVAGEFANVIAGQAKTMLKGTPYHFNISTPSVTRGESISELKIHAGAKLVTFLDCELGPIQIFVSIAN